MPLSSLYGIPTAVSWVLQKRIARHAYSAHSCSLICALLAGAMHLAGTPSTASPPGSWFGVLAERRSASHTYTKALSGLFVMYALFCSAYSVLFESSYAAFEHHRVALSGFRVPFRDEYHLSYFLRSKSTCSSFREERFQFGYVPRTASATRALLRLSPCH